MQTVKSYYTAFALCQVIDIYLAIIESMVLKKKTGTLLSVIGTQKEIKARQELVLARMAFLFGSGFLIPSSAKYLSTIYPLTETTKALDAVYVLLKRLSSACQTYRVLNPLYKRLSAAFMFSTRLKEFLTRSGNKDLQNPQSLV